MDLSGLPRLLVRRAVTTERPTNPTPTSRPLLIYAYADA